MDPIESAVRNNRRFLLSLLLEVHGRLVITQQNKGHLTYEDVLSSLYISLSKNPSNVDVNAHAGLLYEGILVPSMTKAGTPAHKISNECTDNDQVLVDRLLRVLSSRSQGADCLCIDELRRDAQNIVAQTNASIDEVREVDFYASQDPSASRMPQYTLPKYPEAMDLSEDYRSSSLTRLDCERSEPIIRLLAQVRKIGMDILFPQITHDKILACIFAAIKSAATPAHRELIEMVMLVKESRKISHLQSVSKTKVRGVLALLKHGELLITHGNEGNPVRLFLAKGVNSFQDLRERHDAFLLKYMMEHHLFMPAVLKSELVWQVDDETRHVRLEAMNKLVVSIQGFYADLGPLNFSQRPGFDTEESSSSYYDMGSQRAVNSGVREWEGNKASIPPAAYFPPSQELSSMNAYMPQSKNTPVFHEDKYGSYPRPGEAEGWGNSAGGRAPSSYSHYGYSQPHQYQQQKGFTYPSPRPSYPSNSPYQHHAEASAAGYKVPNRNMGYETRAPPQPYQAPPMPGSGRPRVQLDPFSRPYSAQPDLTSSTYSNYPSYAAPAPSSDHLGGYESANYGARRWNNSASYYNPPAAQQPDMSWYDGKDERETEAYNLPEDIQRINLGSKERTLLFEDKGVTSPTVSLHDESSLNNCTSLGNTSTVVADEREKEREMADVNTMPGHLDSLISYDPPGFPPRST